MSRESEPLWPSGVVPLGADDPEEQEHLEAWCRQFVEELTGSGSDVEASAIEPLRQMAPHAAPRSLREARLLMDHGDREVMQKCCAETFRIKALAAGAMLMTVTLAAWFLFKGATFTSEQAMGRDHKAHPSLELAQQRWQSEYGARRGVSDESTAAGRPGTFVPAITKYENYYDAANPLRIKPWAQRSQNYFIIIGDWGKAGRPGSCQYAVAGKLQRFVKAQKQAGKHLLFIASVGDNFYWTGVTPKAWREDWEVPYGPNNVTSALYQVPWLAVYGNHDFGEHDPYAICPHVYPIGLINKQAYSGNQLNQVDHPSSDVRQQVALTSGYGTGIFAFHKDRNPNRPDSTKSFWMPDYNYHYEIPEADLEVIAVDTNGKMDPNLIAGNAKARGIADDVCGGRSVTESFLKAVAKAGDDLVVERAKKSTASTVLIIQHYPGLCPRALFENALTPERRAKVRLICAYGHVHSQRCDVKINGQCMDVLSGGGGGCCGPMVNLAGFTAVHLDDMGGAHVDVESPEVRMAKDTCKW